MNNISFYPTLDILDPKQYEFKINSNFELEYIDETTKEIKTIKVKYSDDKTILRDLNDRWSPNFNNLIIRKKMSFNSSKLFGKNGIAPSGSQIGVYTTFKSSKSLQRGITENLEINQYDGIVEFYLEQRFEKNQIRSDFTLETILYLKEPSLEIYEDEIYLNNTKGMILGRLYEHKFLLSGDGSKFPTEIISDKDAPLWKVFTGGYLEDSIEDNILLEINEAHKDYKLFDYRDKENFNENFVKEVSISVVFQLVNKHREEYINSNKDDFGHGTIGSLLKHYIEGFNLDLSNIDEVFAEINRRLR